jgi:quercetin dioxygenase-like cupin family protein
MKITPNTRGYSLKHGDSLAGPNYPQMDLQLLAGAAQTDSSFALVKYDIAIDVPYHLHDHEDESIYVLEGEVIVYVGDTPHEAPAGTFVFMPKGVPHRLQKVTPSWKGLSVSAPGGIFDAIILDIAALRAEGKEVDMDVVNAIRAQHGWHYVEQSTMATE